MLIIPFWGIKAVGSSWIDKRQKKLFFPTLIFKK